MAHEVLFDIIYNVVILERLRTSRYYMAVSLLAFFLCGFGASYLLFHVSGSGESVRGRIERQGGFNFINPLLICDTSNKDYPAFDDLKSDLSKQIKNFVAQGKISRASIYFRDMNVGHATGVNEDGLYVPASLMKVPVLLAYLENSRGNSDLLNKKLEYKVSTTSEGQYYKPKSLLVPGQYYSVDNLLSSMIIQSDNNSAETLMGSISTTTLVDVYTYAGIEPSDDEDKDFVSPLQYMNLFRLLYNAGYLGDSRSQKALTLLSQTNFDGGIVAGVDGHTVSHKFGERTVMDDSSKILKRELHDCGIIYYPGNPYGLCVMTEGQNFDDMQSVIAQLSADVYKKVSDGLLDAN